MNKFRSLENIIRDVASGRAPLSERLGIMSTIRQIGKKPTEAPLAKEPEDKTISPDDDVEKHIITPDASKEIETTLSQALTPGHEVHKAHKEFARRAQRKLKIIDNP